MLYREIIAVCSQIHTKHINTLCGQNVELLNITPGGSNRWALGGQAFKTQFFLEDTEAELLATVWTEFSWHRRGGSGALLLIR